MYHMHNSLLQESLQNCKPVDFMTVFDADVKIWFWVTKFGKQYPYTCLPWIVEDLHRCFPVFSWNHIHSVRNWNDPPSNSPLTPWQVQTKAACWRKSSAAKLLQYSVTATSGSLHSLRSCYFLVSLTESSGLEVNPTLMYFIFLCLQPLWRRLTLWKQH